VASVGQDFVSAVLEKLKTTVATAKFTR